MMEEKVSDAEGVKCGESIGSENGKKSGKSRKRTQDMRALSDEFLVIGPFGLARQ